MAANASYLSRAGKMLGVLAAAWLACALPFVTDLACPFGWTILLAFTFLVIGAAWVLLIPFRLMTAQPGPGVGWWLVTPAALGVGLWLATSDVGLKLRLAACETQLRTYAETVAPGTRLSQDQWVGLFAVYEVEERQGIVYLYTSTSFLDRHGFAYNPTGASEAPRMRMEHLYGPWYQFRPIGD